MRRLCTGIHMKTRRQQVGHALQPAARSSMAIGYRALVHSVAPLVALASGTFDITQYGAVADNSTINTAVIQRAIAAASQAGGGYVLVPTGVFKTGTVNLTSNVYLQFADGGYLQGSWDSSDYSWDWDYWHVVQALNATNTGLTLAPGSTGAGTAQAGGIVGIMWQQNKGLDPSSQMYTPNPWTGVNGCVGECRVKDAAFVDCTNVILSGVVLLDSSDWTLLLRRTSNVLLENLYIHGSTAWPNGDGIDVESGRNITMRGLDISTGDDCIAMRSGNCNTMRTPWPQPDGAIDPLQDVFISNCTLRSSSAAIKIEALFQAAHGNISNIVIDSINITEGTNRGVGIWQRIGNPTDRDAGGWIRDVVVSNVVANTGFLYSSNWWGSGEPIVITTVPETQAQAAVGLPGIHNISFVNFTAVSENGALFSARDQLVTNPSALDGLQLTNVAITITRRSDTVSTWAQHDYRPVEDNITPEAVPALVDGIYFEHVSGAVLQNVTVTFAGQPQPYWDGPVVPGGRAGDCVNATDDSVITIIGPAVDCSLAQP